MPVAFVPYTAAPTHLGAFRESVTTTAVLAPGPLPDVRFPVRIRAAWGADLAADSSTWVWSDISADVRADQGVLIHRGRVDENTQTQPTSVLFGLNNPDGRYTPRNAAGANYPYVRQNTPFEIAFNAKDTGDWFVRALVYADSWTMDWDQALAAPIVAVSASGLLRLIEQGRTPIRSAIARVVAGQSAFFGLPTNTPTVYWTCEDASGSTSFAEYFGGRPIIPAGSVTFAASATNRASQPLPTFAAGSALVARVPAYTSSAWTVTCMMQVPATPAAKVTLLQINATGAGAPVWRLTLDSAAAFNVEAYNSSGTEVLGAGSVVLDANYIGSGTTFFVYLAVFQSGPDTYADATVVNQMGIGTAGLSSFISGLSVPTVKTIVFAPTTNLGGAAFGHLAFYPLDATINPFAEGVQGWDGEPARWRFQRLCDEQGIAQRVIGRVPEFVLDTNPQTMGVQVANQFAVLLRECEAVGGILSDGLSAGLTFLPQTIDAGLGQFGPGSGQITDCGARYNRSTDLVVDMDLRQLSPGFQPVEDDQRRRNDWTVTRTNGSSGRVIDNTGPQGVAAVGRYDDSTTVNITSDAGLTDQAGWRVHLGTTEQMRYPTVGLNFLRSPELIPQWRACDIGSRITVRNLPDQHPVGDVDLVIEGYTEFCDGIQWSVAINCSPYDPWRVHVVEDQQLGRLDTGGSSLATGLTALAQGTVDTLTVNTDGGETVWITTAGFPGDFPFDIGVDGEQITVTAVTGAVSPQTFTVTRATNGVVRTHQAGALVSLWKPAAVAL